MMPSNRHPVDQLAEVRAQIKALQSREDDLKEQVLTRLTDNPQRGETQTVDGDDFVAAVSCVERETLDRKAVERALGVKFAKCLKKSTSVTIRVSPRAHLDQEAA
jgi:cell pole-organizing protein PopZ